MPDRNTVTLPDLAGLDAFDIGTSEPLKKVTPPATGVTATAIAPVAAAGVALSKIVLCIVAGTIAFFGIYLFVVDVIFRISIRDGYEHVYKQIDNGGSFINTADASKLVEIFRGAAAGFSLPSAEVSALVAFANSAQNTKIISEKQADFLKACAAEKDIAKLEDCGDVLATTLKAAAAGSFNVEKVRALDGFVKTIDDAQRSFQSFWLQVAQLILLNLLLPLLTGLFGYIFGTTQPTSNNKE